VPSSTPSQPDPSNRRAADEWNDAIIKPLQTARDHAHWRAVHRNDRIAGYVERMLEALLAAAHGHRSVLARGEET
jgi:hypothetical protein